MNGKVSFKIAEAGDIKQGALGDCWFLGALSVVANKPELLSNLFVEANMEQSQFTVRFFKDGQWHHITVDNYLPVNSYKTLSFARCLDRREFWVPIVEKAYAKLHGSYKSLVSGWTQEVLVDMTGGVGYQKKISAESSQNDEIWNELVKSNQDDFLLGTMIASKQERESEYGNTGLVTGHAYGILKTAVLNNERIIQCRNPWGSKEWNGDWSDESSKWNNVSMKDKSKVGYKIEDDGSFFISYKDFCQYFTSIEV